MSTTTNSVKTKYKVALLGNQSVGKSSIITKYIYNQFSDEANPTIGIDFLVKSVTYKTHTYRLHLWDTAGQERFRSLIPNYLRDAICAIIVFDIGNKQSLADAEKWLRLYNDNKTMEGYSVLVGNKTDLPYRQVSKEQGKRVAAELKVDYFEISAKTGDNVEQLFEKILENLTNGRCHFPYEPKIADQIKQTKEQEDNSKDRTGFQMTNTYHHQVTAEMPQLNPQPENVITLNSIPQQKPKKKWRCCG